MRSCTDHIVLTNTVTAGSFFKRLTIRRGNFTVIPRDNGNNFDRPRTGLKRVFSKIDKKKVKNCLTELGEK